MNRFQRDHLRWRADQDQQEAEVAEALESLNDRAILKAQREAGYGHMCRLACLLGEPLLCAIVGLRIDAEYERRCVEKNGGCDGG